VPGLLDHLPLLAGPDRLVVLLLALALDAYLGDWGPVARATAPPARLVRAATLDAARRLDRPQRSPATRRARGTLLVAAVLPAAAGIGGLAGGFAAGLPHGWLVELYLLLAALGANRPWAAALSAARALEEGDGERARDALRGAALRPLPGLDLHGIARAGVEALARGLSRHAVAPLFWYVLLGLPGLLVWLAAEVMDAELGRSMAGRTGFGTAAARAAAVLGFVPALLAGLTVAVSAAFVATARPGPAVATMLRDARRHRPPGDGWPLAAFAGALDLALGGPAREGEVVVRAPWIGSGRARATPADLWRAVMLYWTALLAAGGMVAALALAT
jgi:adenosylcobinamide-phosphate synthase